MFKQVVLSATRPKTPSLYSTLAQSNTSSSDMGHNMEMKITSSSFRRYSNSLYLGRSLSWDAMVVTSGERYQAMRRRSKSAKVKPSGSPMEEEVLGEGSNESQIIAPGVIDIQDSNHQESNLYGSESINSPSNSDSQRAVDRIHHLIQMFQERTLAIKTRISKPIGTHDETSPELMVEPKQSTISMTTAQPSSPSRISLPPEWMETYERDSVDDESRWKHLKNRIANNEMNVFDPQSYFYITWLMVVTIAFLYNCWIIFLRSSFPYQTDSNLLVFMAIDYSSDLIYILDILLFKSRVSFVEKGQVIRDVTRCARHYQESSMFKLDCLSLLPTDLLYLIFGPKSILRLPRLLKVQTFWQFFDRIDAIAKWPYFFRILRTLTYMMFLIHLNACAFYCVSAWEGFQANDWVYNNVGNAYIRCFYFSIRTATSISGKMPKPTNIYEYLFMTVSWLLGIFVFAFLIGQIRDIVATATQNKAHYRHIMDSIIRYMSNLNLSDELQHRVRLWMTHAWAQQKLFDESKILCALPMKIQTDLAMDIHYSMLSKVDLFKDCHKTVLRDIVVKLKPVLFLPGDYICKKGEVGQEMYIVSKGMVSVLREDRNGKESVICDLGPGGVFGEISVLGIPGLSRRTATVRSVGFSNLFMLSKTDLWDTLRNYPETSSVLRNKAKQVMQERSQRERLASPESSIDADCIVGESETNGAPKLLQMILQMLPPDSSCGRILHRSRSFNSHLSSSNSSPMRSQKSLAYIPSLRIRAPSISLSSDPEDVEDADGADLEDLDDIRDIDADEEEESL